MMSATKFLVYSILYISFAAFLFVIISCEQNLTIEIKTNDKRLIVVGEFTNDTIVQSVHLYRSGSMITGEMQTTVSGAKLYITDNTDTLYYQESNNTPGLYQTIGKCYGIGGHIYYLSITNIDIDQDGQMDKFSASSIMPVPIQFDSLESSYGLNGDNQTAINNFAYYKIFYNGPDYVYKFMQVDHRDQYSLEKRLGSGEIGAFENEFKVPRVNTPDSSIRYRGYLSIDLDSASIGDTLSFIGYNFTKDQYDFLKAFDNNTSGDPFVDNIFDQINAPSNLPTNIEPADKAAGFFFVYSISRISKVFNP